MRLPLFSDLHAGLAAAVAPGARPAPDVLPGAGDFTNARVTARLPACLDVLRATGKPAVLVPGSNESAVERVAACHG